METIFVGLLAVLLLVLFFGPALVAILQRDPEERHTRHARSERRIGALIAGLLATAVGVSLLAVSLLDGIEVWGLAAGIVFVSIGIMGIMNSRVFGPQAKR